MLLEQFEEAGLLWLDLEADCVFSLVEGRANLLAVEKQVVKGLRELDGGFVEDLSTLLDADYMFGAIVKEDSADIF